jgi:hypothetical protein
MRKLTIFPTGYAAATVICLIIPYFFNGFKAPDACVGAIDAGSIINDCPADLTGSFF